MNEQVFNDVFLESIISTHLTFLNYHVRQNKFLSSLVKQERKHSYVKEQHTSLEFSVKRESNL